MRDLPNFIGPNGSNHDRQMGHFGGRDAKKQNNPAFYRQFFHCASHDGSVSEPAAVPGDLGKT